MGGELILLTGATGHIGYATLIEALPKGYNVRAAIRRESAIDEITATKSIKPYLSRLSFVIVPDITIAGAYDEHVQGVDYVVHVASPLSGTVTSTDYEKHLIVPAVNGTLGILHAALKEPKVKRVVITSSLGSVIPQVPTSAPSFTADNINADPPGPFANGFQAYGASKIRAHNAARNFVETQNPHFGIVNIMPSFVLGKKELAKTPQDVATGSNRVAMLQLLGQSGQGPFPPTTVHIEDVAFLHIAALDMTNNKIRPKYDNFGAGWPELFDLADMKEIVRRRFPEVVEKGILPANGESVERKIPLFDTTRTEEVFGFKFKDLETQVVDLVNFYLQVLEEAKE